MGAAVEVVTSRESRRVSIPIERGRYLTSESLIQVTRASAQPTRDPQGYLGEEEVVGQACLDSTRPASHSLAFLEGSSVH